MLELQTSEEEQLADVLRPFGELVAIGRPGESLPAPGAARIYASDEEWKDVVKRQMQRARLVVIMAAAEENVLWELAQAVRTLEPQKLLILLLDMDAQDYETFRTKADPIFGASLPEWATVCSFARRTPRSLHNQDERIGRYLLMKWYGRITASLGILSRHIEEANLRAHDAAERYRHANPALEEAIQRFERTKWYERAKRRLDPTLSGFIRRRLTNEFERRVSLVC